MTESDTTGELITIGALHPAEHGLTHEQREASTRRFGARCLLWGLGVYAGAFLAAFTAAIAADLTPYDTHAGRLFGLLALLVLISAGTVLVAVGGIERLQRPQRTLARKALIETRHLARQLDFTVQLVSSLPARLAALEQVIDRVPAYGEGVIDGAQLRASAFGPEER